MNFNVSDEEVYSSVSLDLSALEKLDEITQRLTMDALNESDTPVTRKNDSKSGESSEQTPNKRKLNLLGSSIAVTNDEMKYRKKLYPEPSKVLKDKIRCTACGSSLLKDVLKGRGLYFHPLLQVLVCQECRDFYGDGDFPLDDDHSDTYCRWCAQGGSLYCCSACSYVFCKPCIRRNFKHSMLDEIEEEDWKCFACNPDALWKHRAVCWAAREYVRNHPRPDKVSGSSDDEPKKKKKRNGKDPAPKKKKSRASAEMDNEEESVSIQLDEATVKNNEEDRDIEERSDIKQVTEDVDDENTRQILAMRKTCALMEKLTKETHNMTHSISKKTNQLNWWISGKNRSPSKQFPTTPIKLGKMIASYKKILSVLQVHSEDLQKKVTEAEEEWKNIFEDGEKNKEMLETVNKDEEEKKVNGEVDVESGEEEERSILKEHTEEETSMEKGEENDGSGKEDSTVQKEHIEEETRIEKGEENDGSGKEDSTVQKEHIEEETGREKGEENDGSGKEDSTVQKEHIEEETRIEKGEENDGSGKEDSTVQKEHIEEETGIEKGEENDGSGKEDSTVQKEHIEEETGIEKGKENDEGEKEESTVQKKHIEEKSRIEDDSKEIESNGVNGLESGDKSGEDMEVEKIRLGDDEKSDLVNENNDVTCDNSDVSDAETVKLVNEEEEKKIVTDENCDSEKVTVIKRDEEKDGEGKEADRVLDVEKGQAVESEEVNGKKTEEEDDNSINLAGTSARRSLFDIFEDYEQSPTNIPIPPSDSDEDKEEDLVDKDSEKDGHIKFTYGKDSAFENGIEEAVKDGSKDNENELEKTLSPVAEVNMENDPEKLEASINCKNDKEGGGDQVQSADETENSSEKKSKQKTKDKEVKKGKTSESDSISTKSVKIKKEVVEEESNGASKCAKKVRPSKDDRDAKMEFLLDTSLSSEEGGTDTDKRKKKYSKKKSKYTLDGSDSDSSSSVSQKTKKNKIGKESSVEEVDATALISQFDDEKLKAGCFVPLKKLKSDYENIPVTLEPKKNKNLPEEDKVENAIKRLSNLSSLEKTTKNATNDDDSNDSKKKKSRDRKASKKSEKEEKKTSDDDNSNDEAVLMSSDEIESLTRPNKSPDKVVAGMDALAKKMLIDSSASDFNLSDEDDEDPKKKKTEKPAKEDVGEDDDKKDEKTKKKEKEDDEGNSSDDSAIRAKKAWRKDKLLRVKLTETDSDEEEKKWKAKMKKQKSQNDSEEEPKYKVVKTRKMRTRRRLGSSSGSDSIKISSGNSSSDSSDFEDKRKKRKRAAKSDSSEDKSSGSKTKKKQKRRRIKIQDSGSSGGNDDDDDNSSKDNTPSKGRKNIRKVLKGDRLGEETIAAAKEEEERKKRITERQKVYNEIFTDIRSLETLDKLVLDFDPETKKELVYVDPVLVKKLKPHQAKGVKFMWDASFESLKRMKTESGSGCILAHCMGLGKTLQVIALIHTLLSNRKTKVKTVLVICPLNTVLNWVNEFKIWLKDLGTGKDVEVFELSKYRVNVERMYQLKDWHEDGGVMVIGYDMYRNLVNTGRKVRKKVQEVFQTTLVDPGPDLVICDEGHLLKNIQSALSKAVNGIRTARRIVLTGTPLQNNLKEYHCMIQFVKPSLLGTHKEFLNRFVNPISNGQCADSTPHDVRVMKRRAHVLHKMLEGCVQRYDYSVLTPFLPPKNEYVILIRLTELQSKLYLHYLLNFSQNSDKGGGGTSLFNDFQNLQRIWTHPRVLKMSTEKMEKKRLMMSDSEGSLKDFIDDDDEDESDTTDSSESSGTRRRKRKKMKRSCKKNNSSDSDSSDVICLSDENKEKASKDKEEEEDVPKPLEEKVWWETFVEPEDHDNISHSGKLLLLLEILQKCELIGDKVLLFSQSLYSLNLIEYFLEKIDEKTQSLGTQNSQEETEKEEQQFNFIGSWAKGLDYFRIDGSVSGENRSIWCKSFNREDNLRARLFLISTRAGGMGINLVGANRVVLFDASWNPSSDLQSIFRIYRFGQKKPCYVYRFLAQGTMEEKIYNRQVTKLSLASRVLDEHQIERHFNIEDLQELYRYDPTVKNKSSTPMLPKDRLLAELIHKYTDLIDSYHEHDSMLENKAEEELSEEERKAAWEDFENEKKEKLPENIFMDNAMVGGLPNSMYGDNVPYSVPRLLEAIMKKNPNATEEQLQYELRLATTRISQYFNQVNMQRQQMYSQMGQQNQLMGKMPIYSGVRQQVPQEALMQAHYNLQNYYHNPLLPSSSTNTTPMMLPQVSNNASHYVPGAMNNMQQQIHLPQQQQQQQQQQQPPNAHSNVQPKIPSAVEGNGPQPVKLKIRQDLMPNLSDDNDVIIEAVKRRE